MKKIVSQAIFLIILVSQFMGVAKAGNYYADTVRIELNNGSMIELCGQDLINHFPDKFEINKQLSAFLNCWYRLGIGNAPLDNKLLLLYDNSGTGSEITIKQQEYSEYYTFSNSDSIIWTFPKGQILEMVEKNIRVRIYFLDFLHLKEIESMNTEVVFAALKTDIISSTKKTFGNKYVMMKSCRLIKYCKLKENNAFGSSYYKYLARGSNIGEFHASLGTNLQNLKGIWAASIYLKYDLLFNQKMVLKNKYSLQYEAVYDFSPREQQFQEHINHFVGLGYSRNFTNDPAKNLWYGISASYLVKQNGDLFDKNTFNIGFTRTFDNRIEIQPMIYFTNFFKDAYPSLKIGVSF